ncbi:hypothetical protein PTKIN_Ptkin16aG0483800 [Pterospermum kingtungense]
MSTFRRDSGPKDTRRRLGKQDEEARQSHSLQGYSNSDDNNNQDEDFSERHSPLLHTSGENKIKQQQQQPQLISNKNGQISSHFQQENLVESPQGYPAKGDSPLNRHRSYPDLQQQHSSTKISTSAEHSSKGKNLKKAQNTHHLPQEDLMAGATSSQKQPPKEDGSYDAQHQLPSGRVHSPPKGNYHQPCNQDADVSEGHSQQPNLVAPPQGYPPKQDFKVSTSQEQSSKNTGNASHSTQQQLVTGASSTQEQPPKELSSYNIGQPSGRAHSAPKDNHSQLCDQSSGASKQQPSPILAPSPIKNIHPRESNQGPPQLYQQPFPVTASSKGHLSGDDHTPSSQKPKHHQQQQTSNLQPESPQACPSKHPANPLSKPSNTSSTQQHSTNDYDPQKSQAPQINDIPSAQVHATPLESKEDEKDDQKTVAKNIPTNLRKTTSSSSSSSSCSCSSCCSCSIL